VSIASGEAVVVADAKRNPSELMVPDLGHRAIPRAMYGCEPYSGHIDAVVKPVGLTGNGMGAVAEV
jgi:hypothetical protein